MPPDGDIAPKLTINAPSGDIFPPISLRPSTLTNTLDCDILLQRGQLVDSQVVLS